MQLTEDKSFKSIHNVSLTNYDNTSLPAIAAGSCIEINGAFYEVTVNEAIGGSASDGANYIICTPSTSTFSAAWTTTAPTWSDAKQGFYGTGGNANNRYLGYKITKAGTSYAKQRFTYDDNIDVLEITTATITTLNADNYLATSGERVRRAIFDIGFWDMDTYDSVVLSFSATGITHSKIISIEAYIFNDYGTSIESIRNAGRIYTYTPTDSINISRTSGGYFDSALLFKLGNINRGKYVITYID